MDVIQAPCDVNDLPRAVGYYLFVHIFLDLDFLMRKRTYSKANALLDSLYWLGQRTAPRSFSVSLFRGAEHPDDDVVRERHSWDVLLVPTPKKRHKKRLPYGYEHVLVFGVVRRVVERYFDSTIDRLQTGDRIHPVEIFELMEKTMSFT
uniref:AlNc14C214G8970 protein n=1 Tax=Albugo laibachii Nc14 TaxID=890382 RepID=F0WRG8_9STRA|nr:AlNc14C214G8970 [Albugo laibachii Nc14]|eukprot:CCA23931.1 AlNc14C214G8970 [Albugo laibachii Nc14]